jgi:anti-sigma regulatory factor (Ser/Thr protein kinase)
MQAEGKGDATHRRMPLPRTTTAPAVARAWLRERLDEWDLPYLESDCLLVASELVTNAVLHGTGPVLISVELHPRAFSVSVSDGSRSLPGGRDRGELPEGGRGLALVLAFADDFDIELHPDDGKSAVATWHRTAPA